MSRQLTKLTDLNCYFRCNYFHIRFRKHFPVTRAPSFPNEVGSVNLKIDLFWCKSKQYHSFKIIDMGEPIIILSFLLYTVDQPGDSLTSLWKLVFKKLIAYIIHDQHKALIFWVSCFFLSTATRPSLAMYRRFSSKLANLEPMIVLMHVKIAATIAVIKQIIKRFFDTCSVLLVTSCLCQIDTRWWHLVYAR